MQLVLGMELVQVMDLVLALPRSPPVSLSTAHTVINFPNHIRLLLKPTTLQLILPRWDPG